MRFPGLRHQFRGDGIGFFIEPFLVVSASVLFDFVLTAGNILLNRSVYEMIIVNLYRQFSAFRRLDQKRIVFKTDDITNPFNRITGVIPGRTEIRTEKRKHRKALGAWI